MKRPESEVCYVCLFAGRYVGWALLIFGGIVGGLPALGFPHPSPLIERLATYAMATGLLMFATVALLHVIAMRRLRESRRLR